MKKFLAALALLATFVTPAFAVPAVSASDISSIDVSKLTPEQKTQLMAQATELQKQATSTTNISATVRNEATAWGELGANMGKAAVSAAKEIGVAANDFVQTPLGKITMGIVIFKVMGGAIIHLVVGIFLLLTFLSVALYLVLKNKYGTVEYEYVEGPFNAWRRKRVKSARVDDDIVTTNYVAAGICAAAGLVVGLTTIFNV
jgi:hypothetical protein